MTTDLRYTKELLSRSEREWSVKITIHLTVSEACDDIDFWEELQGQHRNDAWFAEMKRIWIDALPGAVRSAIQERYPL